GQRIQEARCRILGDVPGVSRQRRVEKQRIGIRGLEPADIEWRRKIVRENALADADRAIKLIVIEKAATAARCQHGLVPERRERVGKAVVETAGALLEEVIGAGAEAGAGQAGQQAEFGLPRAAAENVDVEDAMQAVLRRQKSSDRGLDRKT